MRTEPPTVFTAKPTAAVDRTYDPLRYCIYTTIVLIAWLVTPALALAAFAGLGVAAYVRARRNGLTKSRCYLGDTRLVIAYLTLLLVIGAAVSLWRVVRLFA